MQHSRMGKISGVIPIGPTDVQQAVEVLHGGDIWSHGGCKEGKKYNSEQEAKDQGTSQQSQRSQMKLT